MNKQTYTIRNMDKNTIDIIKAYAKKHEVTIARAIRELVVK